MRYSHFFSSWMFIGITGLALSLVPSYTAIAAPDFSKFHMDDTDEDAAPKDKSKTQAEPPCISCNANRPIPKDLQYSRKIIQKVESEKKAAQKSKIPCITCGGTALKNKTSVVGENIWSQYPEISGYSEHPEVQAMIKWGLNNTYSHSRGRCLRKVKEAMCRAERGSKCRGGSLVSRYMNFTPVFPEISSRSNPKIGKNAIRSLQDEGFVNLLDDPTFNSMIRNPASAPKGAIMIYKGGQNGGHIEIKTGHGAGGTYVSDFKAPDSVMKNDLAGRASKNYRLVAVMIKPAEKLK